jgi:hypothetical protein
MLRAVHSKTEPDVIKSRPTPSIHHILALLLALAAWTPVHAVESSFTEAGAPADAWRFRVYLDEREIGYHNFYLEESGDTRELLSEANFEYRLVFVKLFHYEHENRETWSGNCLQSVASRTDSNGEPYRVDGRLEPGSFRVEGSAGEAELPECVMSFAYWNPAFLEQGQLLNTQNGEFLDVEISPPVAEQLSVRGEQQTSYRYRLEAGELRLDLWYSANKEWLALESEVRGGRKLRYELL